MQLMPAQAPKHAPVKSLVTHRLIKTPSELHPRHTFPRPPRKGGHFDCCQNLNGICKRPTLFSAGASTVRTGLVRPNLANASQRHPQHTFQGPPGADTEISKDWVIYAPDHPCSYAGASAVRTRLVRPSSANASERPPQYTFQAPLQGRTF